VSRSVSTARYARGIVHIDWSLVFAPKNVLECVVAHELAHLQHRSRGDTFWAFLEFMLPDCRQPKAWLDWHQGGLDAAFLVS
jgi:predicted metal-dependent hydrolase